MPWRQLKVYLNHSIKGTAIKKKNKNQLSWASFSSNDCNKNNKFTYTLKSTKFFHKWLLITKHLLEIIENSIKGSEDIKTVYIFTMKVKPNFKKF